MFYNIIKAGEKADKTTDLRPCSKIVGKLYFRNIYSDNDFW